MNSLTQPPLPEGMEGQGERREEKNALGITGTPNGSSLQLCQ